MMNTSLTISVYLLLTIVIHINGESVTKISTSYLSNANNYHFTPSKLMKRENLLLSMERKNRNENNKNKTDTFISSSSRSPLSISSSLSSSSSSPSSSSSEPSYSFSLSSDNSSSQKTIVNETQKFNSNDKNSNSPLLVSFLNASALPLQSKHILEEIYDHTEKDDNSNNEKIEQIGSWLRKPVPTDSSQHIATSEAQTLSNIPISASSTPVTRTAKNQNIGSSGTKFTDYEEDDYDHNHHNIPIVDSNIHEPNRLPAGFKKQPNCANDGRYYCSYIEDYPVRIVTEVTRYYKWPLEKLFRDIRHQVMPKLATDNQGGLVCESITRVIRPGWAKNTNNNWLVVVNTDLYQQFISEVICRNGPNSRCNYVPPCYHATCQQRYNTQKLLVIDPSNPYKGPFLSEFLFPSSCICYVPMTNEHGAHNPLAKQKA